jgi:hypothetical protein
MTNSSSPYRVSFLALSAAMVVPGACSTQEISADPVVIPDDMPSVDHGVLRIAVAPSESSFEEQQATAATNTNRFEVFLDGKQLAWWSEADGAPQPLVVYEGGTTGVGYLPAGSHQFGIRRAYGGPTVFVGDGEIAAGAMTDLYLFGPDGALDGRFVSYPTFRAAGTAHVVLINVVRSGQSLEAVKCVDDTSHCTPVSAPLALGETFEGDFPIDATQDWPDGRFIVSNGGGLGYRQVPTAVVPDPPVLPFSYGVLPVDRSTWPGPTLVAAPIYMSPRGDIQASF